MHPLFLPKSMLVKDVYDTAPTLSVHSLAEETDIYQVIVIESNILFHQLCGANDCKAHNYFTCKEERRNAKETGMLSVLRYILFSKKRGRGSMP